MAVPVMTQESSGCQDQKCQHGCFTGQVGGSESQPLVPPCIQPQFTEAVKWEGDEPPCRLRG